MPHLDERPASFVVEGQRLHGTYHYPTNGRGAYPIVILLHGFTGHRGEAHRLFVLFSRLLAENGIASLRFDFRGSGESEGLFSEMTAQRELEDVRHAYRQVIVQPEVNAQRVGLLGLSMGGMIAALAAGEPDMKFKTLTLWAPASPDGWLNSFPEGMTPDTMPETEDLGGNPVGRDFFQKLRDLDSFGAAARFAGPSLVVHGEADQAVPVSNGRKYAEILKGDFHPIAESGHTFETVRHQEEAMQTTLEWLK
ncbi:MAG TPA: alpha/beta fold hydrolase, partial [Deinococcales bacterium]|nr:alpha/beta fold hydrolase [Deinococcales bacterium]